MIKNIYCHTLVMPDQHLLFSGLYHKFILGYTHQKHVYIQQSVAMYKGLKLTGDTIMVKKLNKADVEFWCDKVNNTYCSYRSRVRDSVPETDFSDIDERVREALLPLLLERVTKQVMECKNIHDGVWIDSVGPTTSRELIPEELLNEVDELNEKRCKSIRKICTKACEQRDEYLMILHSSPDVDVLTEIDAWCKNLDKQFPSKSCHL